MQSGNTSKVNRLILGHIPNREMIQYQFQILLLFPNVHFLYYLFTCSVLEIGKSDYGYIFVLPNISGKFGCHIFVNHGVFILSLQIFGTFQI